MGYKSLGWMALAQIFFAAMNVCTRLGARDLPWSEIAAARFLIGGAQIAMTRAYALHRAAPVTALSGLGIVLTHLLAIPVFGDRPTGWQVAGSLLVIAASLLLTLGGEPAPARVRARNRS